FVRRLQMPDLRRYAGLPGNRDYLVDGFENPPTLGTLMSEIDSTVLGSDLCKFDDLVCRGKTVGYVLQRCAQTKCSLRHGRGDELFHLFQFSESRRTIVLADHVISYSPGADKRGDVDGGP